jgi:lipid A 3-O-deacylase
MPPDTMPASVELRAGALLHDRTLSLAPRAEEGVDANLEALLPSPDTKIFRLARSPRPHIGVSLNTDGGTSALYAGFTWRFLSYGALSLDGSFGAAVHNGKLHANEPAREGLGSRGLFRMSAELVGMILPRQGLSLLVDHMSNAGLTHENDGITNVGVRYLHRF